MQVQSNGVNRSISNRGNSDNGSCNGGSKNGEIGILRAVKVRPFPEKIDAVILDWAGTTIDYGCFAPVKAFERIFIARGIEPTDAEVRAPMGQAKRDHIVAMLSGERLASLWQERYGRKWTQDDVDEMYAYYEGLLFGSLTDFCELKPGTLDAVAMLRQKKLKIGSTTGYTPEMMKVVSEEARARGYAPDTYVTPNCVGFGRPHPYMIFENMRRLGVKDVSKVIKVGDTLSDIEEGKNAKVYTIAVVEGSSEMGLRQHEFEALSPQRKAELSSHVALRFLVAGADAIVQEISDLEALFACSEHTYGKGESDQTAVRLCTIAH